jgi:hypothetical protein
MRPLIVVETANEAHALTLNDVWPPRKDAMDNPSPDGDSREFNGEQAISSAILRLTQKSKTAVVFARFGGLPSFSIDPALRQMIRRAEAPFEQLKTTLENQNFIPVDWDLATAKEAPTVPDAVRYVYVVLPPSIPPDANPEQPPPRIGPPEIKAITDAVEKAGCAMFLADGVGFQYDERVRMYFPDPFKAAYEFGDYLRANWGIDVRHNFVVTSFRPTGVPGKWTIPALPPGCFWLPTPPLRFGEHEIVRPLKSSAGVFFQAAPLALTGPATQPATDENQRVSVTTLVDVKPTEDCWAIRDFMHILTDLRAETDGGTAPLPDDLKPPFPLAVAATKDNARVVVSGSSTFAYDEIRTMSRRRSPRDPQREYFAPANTDLFVNALHWLTGDAGRIAVGPRGSDVPRLYKLEEGPVAAFWRWFLVGLWPAVVLLAGVGVWLVRRR